ncbi:unnamed protein product, partial [Choristocarpus tenellus]
IVWWSHGASVPAWTYEMMSDPEVAQYVDGMAFHWYWG